MAVRHLAEGDAAQGSTNFDKMTLVCRHMISKFETVIQEEELCEEMMLSTNHCRVVSSFKF